MKWKITIFEDFLNDFSSIFNAEFQLLCLLHVKFLETSILASLIYKQKKTVFGFS